LCPRTHVCDVFRGRSVLLGVHLLLDVHVKLEIILEVVRVVVQPAKEEG
jgi:hypothetical protein